MQGYLLGTKLGTVSMALFTEGATICNMWLIQARGCFRQDGYEVCAKMECSGYQVRDSVYGSVTEGATGLRGGRGYQGRLTLWYSALVGLTVSRLLNESEHRQVYLLVGSMDLMLELTLLCSTSPDTKGAKA